MHRFSGGARRVAAWRAAAITATVLATGGATAQLAGATVLVQNHTDPAGDPAAFSFHLSPPSGLPASDFQLRDGLEEGFGPFEGQVAVVDVPPAGWQVADIRCVGPSAAAFAIDIAGGRVTMQHRMTEEQICSFTNRRISPQGGSPASPNSSPSSSSPGLAPAPPSSALRKVVTPRTAVLLDVLPRHRGATARVRLVKSSVVRTQLLWRGRAVGSSRVVRAAGLYDVTVALRPSVVQRLRHAGRRHVTLDVRMVVAPLKGKTTVFHYGVIVAL
jgi:hypothetical protein